MGHQEHRAAAPVTVRLAVLGVSTTRRLADDASGRWITAAALRNGLSVVDHRMAEDSVEGIRDALTAILTDHSPQAVIICGGTGITAGDVTIEALRPLFTKELTAFAPLFAQLSYQRIGTAALMSRATAGLIGATVIFCLPGSLAACQLACDELIFPELGHLAMHAAAL